MTRIPVLDREDMDPKQRATYDHIANKNSRVGYGPAIGYAYSSEVWRLHNESSTHLLNCALNPAQVRIISLMTVRHWNAAYPWSAQAKTALNVGLEPSVVEAINAGQKPKFNDPNDAGVYSVTKELLSSGTLSHEAFSSAQTVLGYRCIVEVVAAIGHFCTTAMMANVVGAEPPIDAPSHLIVETNG